VFEHLVLCEEFLLIIDPFYTPPLKTSYNKRVQ